MHIDLEAYCYYHNKSISKVKFGIFITFGITYVIVPLAGWEGRLVGM